eukprot:Blabericola_migrator_1__1768@NODE_1479_length_4459_cov_8_118625_g970_i0_p4_GENE_NODE_1479_length_4459_cov_8_118625_g970_i0NODE_1479_length_4459_cov_8_118625_g970_i0_p4_ORF_typecomplete_len106_score3_48Peptidase_S78/PF04586_17/0_15_NODE_1479_length_4459_cov_8_118625_g970_i017602077
MPNIKSQRGERLEHKSWMLTFMCARSRSKPDTRNALLCTHCVLFRAYSQEKKHTHAYNISDRKWRQEERYNVVEVNWLESSTVLRPASLNEPAAVITRRCFVRRR